MKRNPGGRTGKADSLLTNNLLGLIIWKHMYGIPWVKNILLDIGKNPLDVTTFTGYKDHIEPT